MSEEKNQTRWRYLLATSERESLPITVVTDGIILLILLAAGIHAGFVFFRAMAFEGAGFFGCIAFLISGVIVLAGTYILVKVACFHTCRYSLTEDGILLKEWLHPERCVPWDEISSIDLCMVWDGTPGIQAIRCKKARANMELIGKRQSFYSQYRTFDGDDSLNIIYCFLHRDDFLVFYQTDTRIMEFQEYCPLPFYVEGLSCEQSDIIPDTVLRYEKEAGIYGAHAMFPALVLFICFYTMVAEPERMDVWMYVSIVGASIMFPADLYLAISRSLLNRNWKLAVSADTLEYVNRFGRRQTYDTKQVCWSKSRNKIILWYQGRQICRVDCDVEDARVLYKLRHI